jgi:hypothetical protein
MHARALKGAALSARRIEDLEARMIDLESDIEELVVRVKKSDKYVCPVCDATFDSTKALTVCFLEFQYYIRPWRIGVLIILID